MYLEDGGREWMEVVVCKKREMIKKIKNIWYFNEI